MFEITDPIVYYKSSENMDEIKDNSIQLIVTSPPYGKIKDYGLEGQIGFSDTFEEYFKRLNRVWGECYRVLESQCRMVINIGDQYLRTAQYGRYRIMSITSRIINDCFKLGFDFFGDIIWQKISTTNTTGGCSLMGSIYYPRNGLLTYDYEHILIFKKHEGKKRKVDLQTKELSKISLSEWKKWYIGHWRFPGIIQKEHIAMFPEELPYRIIRMFSFIGDIVLDPFVGSGTTLKVAKSLFRKSIGYEINEDFKDVIKTKVQDGKIDNFQDYQLLIYHLYQKAKDEGFEIEYIKQKQKGIIIIKNSADLEVILDYFLIEDVILDEDHLLKEIKSKLAENTIQNYLKEKENWNTYKTYILIINSKLTIDSEIISLIKKHINSLKYNKKIMVIPLKDVISKDFNLKEFFK